MCVGRLFLLSLEHPLFASLFPGHWGWRGKDGCRLWRPRGPEEERVFEFASQCLAVRGRVALHLRCPVSRRRKGGGWALRTFSGGEDFVKGIWEDDQERRALHAVEKE